ncbi:MAG: FixH family protein [Patescibacteria group bacterium]
MNNKTLVIILAVMVIAVAYLGWKSSSVSDSGTATGTNGAISLSTDPNPLRPGKATFMIDVKDKSGKPVDNATVSFDFNMTAMNMGTQRGDATSQGNGRYSAVANMSMRGPWLVKTKVKMPDGSIENKDFTVNVP